MSQHAGLTAERWRRFTPDQRLLMIANEMNRVAASLRSGAGESVQLGYERVLRLADLSAQCAERLALRRELLRWRHLVAERYIGEPDAARHAALLKALLQLSPAGWAQWKALEAHARGAE